jgi:uroporphyrinogen decarboxylase
MKLIDLLNWVGTHKLFRPLGKLLLFAFAITPFSRVARMAGRRMVSAFAAAPAALQSGSTIREALHDPSAFYKTLIYTIETMKLDTVCLFADMSLEAEACGCQVQFEDEILPSIKSHPVNSIEDIGKLPIPDPYRDGRMPVFLETMRRLKKNLTVITIGEISGPFTLATSLGGTDVYADVRKDKRKVEALLQHCEKVLIRYGRALSDAGADMILVAEPSGSQLSKAAYEQFSLPFTRNIIRSLELPCILHICGNAGHIVEKMVQSGAAALSLDDVEITEVLKTVPPSIVIIGNISPRIFYMNTPKEIEIATSNLLEAVKNRKEFLIAPGCDLAPQTPLENIRIFTETVKHQIVTKSS